MNLFCSICRGEIFDTSLSPLNSLHFVRYEGKCERNGTLLPFYFFEIDDSAFDHLLSVNDVNHYGAERLRDAWMTMIQSLIHDICLVNEADDQFVFEVKIQDWMGPRYVVGLLRTEDHHVCAISPPGDCETVHRIVFPMEIMWTPKWLSDPPPSVVLTQEDVDRAGSLSFV